MNVRSYSSKAYYFSALWSLVEVMNSPFLEMKFISYGRWFSNPAGFPSNGLQAANIVLLNNYSLSRTIKLFSRRSLWTLSQSIVLFKSIMFKSIFKVSWINDIRKNNCISQLKTDFIHSRVGATKVENLFLALLR